MLTNPQFFMQKTPHCKHKGVCGPLGSDFRLLGRLGQGLKCQYHGCHPSKGDWVVFQSCNLLEIQWGGKVLPLLGKCSLCLLQKSQKLRREVG
jgi:hypothetical protein